MKTSETKPEFAGSDDDVRQEIPSRPIRDPSLDGLLIGLEERLDHGPGSGAKLRTHTPPSAHTDPFPEEPVVAPHLTAPLSAVIAEKVQPRPRPVAASGEPARPARLQDPTYVLDREPSMTPRAWMIVGACGVIVAGALGVAVWATTRDPGQPAARVEPAVTVEKPAAAALSSWPLAALPSAGVASALTASPPPATSSSAKPGKPNTPTGVGRPASVPNGPTVDVGLE